MFKSGTYIIIEHKELNEIYVAIVISENDYKVIKKIENGVQIEYFDNLFINEHNKDEFNFITEIKVDVTRAINSAIKKNPEYFL